MEPVTGGLILEGGGALLAGLQGNQMSGEAKSALRAQAALADQQRQIGSEEYNRYLTNYAPLEGDIANMARTAAIPNYDQALRNASSEYLQQRGNMRGEAIRSYGRMGIDPSNPMYAGGINRTAISDALAMTTARNMAREAERNRTYNQGFGMRMQAVGLGRGMVGNAMGGLSSAGGMYGQIGNTYGQMGSNAWGAAGYLANSAARQMYGMSSWGQPKMPAGVDNQFAGTPAANYG